ncbi:MAG: Lrp/AsnC family transcriptional regulator, partial [Thaumarchaeota archaeon]|nr:Lrp/AsnC family transcriptional regulator [Nitrososphaerota archaeon]
MSKAFILINCELGSEEQIISELKTFSDIKKVQGTFG